jgi:hypothetical protein
MGHRRLGAATAVAAASAAFGLAISRGRKESSGSQQHK